MKKSFFVAALLCLLLASCGGDDTKSPETTADGTGGVTTEITTDISLETTVEITTEATTEVTTEVPLSPESEDWLEGGRIVGTVRYTYADDGHTVKRSEYYNNEGVLRRVIDHDSMGRKKTDVSYLKDGSETNNIKYFYDGDSTSPSRTELYAEGVLKVKETFDDEGKPVLSEWYSETGGRIAYTEWTYDDRGNNTYAEHRDSDNDYNDWTEEREFNGDDVCIRLVSFRHGYKNVCEYNNAGKTTAVYTYNPESILESHTLTSYHPSGHRYEVISYKGDVQVSYNRYDENGDIKEKREVKSDGSVEHTVYGGDSETTTRTYSDGKTYVVVKKDGKYVKHTSYNSDGEETYRTEREYDDRGRETKSTRYDKGVLCSIEEWEYGAEEGEYIRYTENYDADGKATSYSKCEYKKKKMVCDTYYDADRNVLKVYEYDSDGKCKTFTEYGKENIIVWQYQSGKVVSCSIYDTDGNLLRTDEYDSNQLVKKAVQYNSDGTREAKIYENVTDGQDTYSRMVEYIKYDAKGLKVISREYDEDDIMREWSYRNGKKVSMSKYCDFKEYVQLLSTEEYDSKGRRTKLIQYNDDGTNEVFEYDSEKSSGVYQNGNGPLVKYTKFDRDLREVVLREYSDNVDGISVAEETMVMEETYEYLSGETVHRVMELSGGEGRIMQSEYVYCEERGGLIEEKHFFTDGEFLMWAEFEHRTNWLKETYYTEDGAFNSCNIREYENKNGKQLLVKHSYCDTEGNVTSYVEYIYDKYGNEAQRWNHRADGYLEIWEFIYGYVFRMAYYDPQGLMIYRTETEYDDNWNKTKYTVYYGEDGTWEVTEYKDGKEIKTTKYAPDGSIIG